MKALIFDIHSLEDVPVGLAQLPFGETVLSRQLQFLAKAQIREIFVVTADAGQQIEQYCAGLSLPGHITVLGGFSTESQAVAKAGSRLDGDIVILKGGLVFDEGLFTSLLFSEGSKVAASSSCVLLENELKASVSDGVVTRLGKEIPGEAIAVQPFYHLRKADWAVWRGLISSGKQTGRMEEFYDKKVGISPVDMESHLCYNVATAGDLSHVWAKLEKLRHKMVYMCFGADSFDGKSLSQIKEASQLGTLTVGIVDGGALPFEEAKGMAQQIKGVSNIIRHDIDYIKKQKPDYVVVGDGLPAERNQLATVLDEYGGQLLN